MGRSWRWFYHGARILRWRGAGAQKGIAQSGCAKLTAVSFTVPNFGCAQNKKAFSWASAGAPAEVQLRETSKLPQMTAVGIARGAFSAYASRSVSSQYIHCGQSVRAHWSSFTQPLLLGP